MANTNPETKVQAPSQVDRVARAICLAAGTASDDDPFRTLARAAVAAMDEGWQPIDTVPDGEEIWVAGFYKPQTGSPRGWITRTQKIDGKWGSTVISPPVLWYPSKPPPLPEPPEVEA